jgi:viroplasmin and RNaseH domain-containing protein
VYYGVRGGLKSGVFLTSAEVGRLTFGVKGSAVQRFETREQAEVFATAERLYAVDKVERNAVLETSDEHNRINSRAFPGGQYKFFATRQEAEAFLQPNDANNAEANSTSEDAGKVPVVWCLRRSRSIMYVCM